MNGTDADVHAIGTIRQTLEAAGNASDPDAVAALLAEDVTAVREESRMRNVCGSRLECPHRRPPSRDRTGAGSQAQALGSAALASIGGILLFGEGASATRLLCLALIVAGILGVTLVEQARNNASTW